MIELKNVFKSYDTKVAVDGLDIKINDGEIFGFIGPNGAGKTTTIKMIVGILKPDKGEVSVNGTDVYKEPIKAKINMAYVPDSPDLYEKLTGIQFINFIANAYNVPIAERKKRIEELSEIFEMKEALGDLIESYSHGMRQKTVLMSALVHSPQTWILDEPLVGLDPQSAFTLKKMMREHADNGNTVFFSTHILEVAEKLCDRVGIIIKGKLVACGTLDELRAEKSESLENIFMGIVDK